MKKTKKKVKRLTNRQRIEFLETRVGQIEDAIREPEVPPLDGPGVPETEGPVTAGTEPAC